MDWQKNGFRLLLVILVMGGIFYLSHQPGGSFSLPDIVNIDKLLHCLVYAVLGCAFLFTLPPHWSQQHPCMVGCMAVLFCLFYGVTDEFHQSFIPGHNCAATLILWPMAWADAWRRSRMGAGITGEKERKYEVF
jgi:VanZ family protein